MLIKGLAGDTPILLYKKGDAVCAISETCSHAGGPLSEGELHGNLVQCPWHASRFDIRTGQVKGGPATISQVRYQTRVQNGQIEVRRSEDTLQPNGWLNQRQTRWSAAGVTTTARDGSGNG